MTNQVIPAEIYVVDFEPRTYNDFRVKYFSEENIVMNRIEVSNNVIPYFCNHTDWPKIIDMDYGKNENDGRTGVIFGAPFFVNSELDYKDKDIGVIKMFGYNNPRTLCLVTRLTGWEASGST